MVPFFGQPLDELLVVLTFHHRAQPLLVFSALPKLQLPRDNKAWPRIDWCAGALARRHRAEITVALTEISAKLFGGIQRQCQKEPPRLTHRLRYPCVCGAIHGGARCQAPTANRRTYASGDSTSTYRRIALAFLNFA